jgi:hypothetical protein
MAHNDEIFLFLLRGTLSPPTLEDARQVHNQTAGNDQGVAAARALGDLSHNVFSSIDPPKSGAGELLIMDLWNSFSGFEKFFSDPQVQQGGGMIFTQRDPTVWTRAAEIRSFSIPSPRGKGDRHVGLIRGQVHSRESARKIFDALTKETINSARKLGQVSHDVYFRMTPPGQPPSLELLGVDLWQDAEGMATFYRDPIHLAPLRDLFSAPPVASTWRQPPGQWVEW